MELDPRKVEAFNKRNARKQLTSAKLNLARYCLITGEGWEFAVEKPIAETNLILQAYEYEKAVDALLMLNVLAASKSQKGYKAMAATLKKRIKEIESSL